MCVLQLHARPEAVDPPIVMGMTPRNPLKPDMMDDVIERFCAAEIKGRVKWVIDQILTVMQVALYEWIACMFNRLSCERSIFSVSVALRHDCTAQIAPAGLFPTTSTGSGLRNMSLASTSTAVLGSCGSLLNACNATYCVRRTFRYAVCTLLQFMSLFMRVVLPLQDS